MAIAHEAYVRSHAGVGVSTSESSFSFDLAATSAAGVLVFVLTSGNTSNLVSAVDVEGVAASAVSGGRAVDTGGETGDCQAWFVGSGLPSGTLTITVTRTNNSTPMWAYAMSVTALADTEAYATGLVLDQEDGTLAERSVDDGSPGTDSLRYCALNTGLSAPPSVGANTTSLAADDYGARCSVAARETTAGQGSRSIGWSSGSSDDRAGVYVAIREVASAGAAEGSGVATAATGSAGQGYALHYGSGTGTAATDADGVGYVLHYGSGTSTAASGGAGEGEAPTVGTAEGSGVGTAASVAAGEGYALHYGYGTTTAATSGAGEGLAPSTTAEGSGVATAVSGGAGEGYVLHYGSGAGSTVSGGYGEGPETRDVGGNAEASGGGLVLWTDADDISDMVGMLVAVQAISQGCIHANR